MLTLDLIYKAYTELGNVVRRPSLIPTSKVNPLCNVFLKPENLQDRFLNQARKDRTTVTLFLMNGFQLRGTILSFDQFAVLVLSDNRQNLIYKHAISTIQPAEPVKVVNN